MQLKCSPGASVKPPVICAQPVGYGPAGKALAVAEHLSAAGVRPILLGHGIAHELLERNPQVGEAVNAAPNEVRARDLIQGASAVLSVMDKDYARLALDLGLPLHVADSLSWLRRPMPGEFLEARRYWVQNFPGVPQHARTLRTSPTVIGPILPAQQPANGKRKVGLVVSLGGYDSPYGQAGDDSGYADFVLGCMLDAGLPGAFASGSVVMTGRRAADDLSERFRGCGLTFVSLPYCEAAGLRARADVFLTAPGMTSTLEGFRAGVPTFFLPPQSASQWWILARLRKAGVAPSAFHWGDLLPADALDESMTIPQRISIVRRLIADLTLDGAARRDLRVSLESLTTCSRDQITRAQGDFFRSLGSDGARTLAAALLEEAGLRSSEERTQQLEDKRA